MKAIMVMMDTCVTNSLANVMKPQPILPKGQGYWCHIKNISIGITERESHISIEYFFANPAGVYPIPLSTILSLLSKYYLTTIRISNFVESIS